MKCIKFSVGPAFESFCKIVGNRNVTLWLDYITLHTPNLQNLRFEETNLHLTVDYKPDIKKLVITRASLKTLLVNGSTLSFDEKLNMTVIEVNSDGVWVECNGKRSRFERREGGKEVETRIEMEGEGEGEKGRIVLLPCKT